MQLIYTDKFLWFRGVDHHHLIVDNFPDCVGVMTNPQILNENKRCVGEVVMINSSTNKIILKDVVEFQYKNLKYNIETSNENNETIILINPYFIRKWTQTVFLEVPVEVWNEKEDKIEIEMVRMNFNMFIERKILEIFGDFQHRLIAAIKNYRRLRYKRKDHLYAMNATVKHYKVPFKILGTSLRKYGGHKKHLISVWNKMEVDYFKQNSASEYLKRFSDSYNEPKILDIDAYR